MTFITEFCEQKMIKIQLEKVRGLTHYRGVCFVLSDESTKGGGVTLHSYVNCFDIRRKANDFAFLVHLSLCFSIKVPRQIMKATNACSKQQNTFQILHSKPLS